MRICMAGLIALFREWHRIGLHNWINMYQDQIAFASVCLIIVGVILLRKVCASSRVKRQISLIVCSVYTVCVLCKTVFSRVIRSPQIRIDFLWSYRAWLSGQPGMLSQIYLNILLFVPFGLLTYAALTGKRKGALTAILGIVLSISIELLQLYFHRGTFELDDILNNTIGTIIGALIAYGIEYLFERREKKFETKR